MYLKKYQTWLNSEWIDEATKKELALIEKDENEIKERFYKDLEFGTGGLRGIIGAGSDRMNKYTVRKATQGLATYILKQAEYSEEKGVAIAYDSRHKSQEFAQEAALVLNGNGIKTYVFETLRPTPELSFAVRKLNCISGIVITASHNPKEYNGYKAYWSDGCQVLAPRDKEIIDEVNKIEDFSQIKVASQEEANQKGLFNIIGKEIDDEFIETVKTYSLNKEVIKEVADELKIVYTPFNGTGNKPVTRILKELGLKNVYVVPEQENPDPDFTTVGYPNPEDPKAFKLAIQLAKEKDADIILGTDPDADRLGVLVKNPEGEYEILTGNMTGVLLAEYILSQKQQKGTLPKDGVVIKTIVSTEMIKAIAQAYQVEVMEVLTGFKYIGEKIKQFEENNDHTYLFGFEESYGCLAGTFARDKDSVSAVMLICELAAVCKQKGITLYEHLQELYKKYGYYKESLKSLTLKGLDGIEKMKVIMETLRKQPPLEFAGKKVIEIRDYKQQNIKRIGTSEEGKLTLQKSDVLYFILDDESWFCVRPSGTEPKIKFYFGVKGQTEKEASEKVEIIVENVMSQVENI